MEKTPPHIEDCNARDCSHNRDGECLGGKLIIGSRGLPQCNSYTKRAEGQGPGVSPGAVVECREELCAFNHAFECACPAVTIRVRKGHPDCADFSSRMVFSQAA